MRKGTKIRRPPYANRCAVGVNPWQALDAWYASPVGRELAAVEDALLAEVLGNLFGYHLLQVGTPARRERLEHSRVSRRLLLDIGSDAGHDGAPGRFRGEAPALPVRGDSLDVIVLPHVLEFTAHPHQVLREVDRTLVPEGHVVILGFNPVSLWQLWRWTLGWRGHPPWCGRFYSAARVRDWLALLGFEVTGLRHYFWRPPIQQSGILQRLGILDRLGRRWWPILGAGYVLVARKRVSTLTPIRPRWRPSRVLRPAGVIEPTPRRSPRTMEKSR